VGKKRKKVLDKAGIVRDAIFSPTDFPAKANYFNYLSAIDFATART